MKKNVKRVLSVILTIALLLTSVPLAFAAGSNEPLTVDVTTTKPEYVKYEPAEITVTVTNTSEENVNRISAEAVFTQLAPCGKNSELTKEAETLKPGESFSFTYQAMMNEKEYSIKWYEKIAVWFIRVLHGCRKTSDNGFNDGRECITDVSNVKFGNFNAENTVKVWYEEQITDKDYQELIKGVDIDETYKHDNNNISVDEETGEEYFNNILVVMFEDKTTNAEKAKIIKSVNGKVVGGNITYNELFIEIKKSTLSELRALCDKLNENNNVYAYYDNAYDSASFNATPNDPYKENNAENAIFDDANWESSALNIWGQYAIKAPGAWAYNDYFNNINIGIIDRGFDTSHEDLDIEVISEEKTPANHGTHVAGIIGATSDNDTGIAGIVKNKTLYGYDLYNDKWKFSSSDIYTGLEKLVKENNCQVINISQGKNLKKLKNSNDSFSPFTIKNEGKTASKHIADLIKINPNFLIVQSAGNGAKNPDSGSKADLGIDAINNGSFASITRENCYHDDKVSVDDIMNRVIIVTSAKNDHGAYTVATSANGGNQVNIAAPGDSVYSTVAGIYEKADDGTVLVTNGQKYAFKSATSMAAPMVSGVASLVWSINPDLSAADVKDIILSTADKGVVKDNPASPNATGDFDMLNAKAAVEEAFKRNHTTCTLTGKVTNEAGESLSAVDVAITNLTNKQTIIGTTDVNGNYSVVVPTGDYSITFSKYQHYDVTTESMKPANENETVNLGTTVMKEISIDGKVEYNGHEYQVFNDSMTWHEAKAYCENLGGHLVTITSLEENKFVKGLAEKGKKIYWYGATDSEQEGTWKWITGEPFKYTKWAFDEPSNSNGGEDYLEGDCNRNFYWNDSAANGGTISDYSLQKHGFICEWEKESEDIELIGSAIGTVKEKDTDTPLSGVTVTASNNDTTKTTQTDENGEFEIILPVGTWNITFSSNTHYSDEIITVNIEKDVISLTGGAHYMTKKDNGNKDDENDKNVKFDGGDGTTKNPYQLSTPEQLNAVRYHLDKHFIQTADIDMSNWGNWKPIGGDNTPFSGSYNGNSYAIYKLTCTYDNSESYIGLFGNAPKSTLKNINLISCYFTSEEEHEYNGAIVGYGNKITNCTVIGNISFSGLYCGGIVGKANSLDNCYFEGSAKFSGRKNSPGIVSGYFGGICGSGSSITKCHNSASITGTGEYSSYMGGIAGSGGNVSESSNSGILELFTTGPSQNNPEAYLGGITGAGADISNCYNIGNLKVDSRNYTGMIGGITGMGGGTYSCCYNTGKLTNSSRYSWMYIGGIIGLSQFRISTLNYCYSNIPELAGTGAVGSKTSINNSYELSEGEFSSKSSFIGFDFDNIWAMDKNNNNGMPYLKNQKTV